MECGRTLSTGDLTISGLQSSGHEVVFMGIGLPDANRSGIFKDLGEDAGFYTSKDFLPLVSAASKPGLCGCKSKLPSLQVRRHVMSGRDDTRTRPNDLTRGPDMSEKSRHPLPDMKMDIG